MNNKLINNNKNHSLSIIFLTEEKKVGIRVGSGSRVGSSFPRSAYESDPDPDPDPEPEPEPEPEPDPDPDPDQNDADPQHCYTKI